ncbi:Insulin-like growth factor binding protein, N-terminal [Pseudocohnilembus persalinus]|uniref:Insulin-like growth factor binding protein, N-terminal n=1 Tax=Pseudocohnilembus persalinus TaxID=266149 RepID=A0A0V0QN75_PSEPJ|nr:Insulin-like growth factor binding protein, N-terminal [Pseudocohnilembus persalinus]|eukprot:KRX03775.1 Insulin-like growth factor binding protein, N-terminal [Pseudocohnilembus persalinus]
MRCDQCNYRCKNCKKESYLCSQCQGINRDILNYCYCEQDSREVNGTCQKVCKQNCEECNPITGDCLKCKSGLNRSINDKSQQCACSDGYKENDEGMCIRCYMLNNSCLDKCPGGTFQDENLFI